MSQEYRASEAEFEKAIELDPKNYEAWYFFGRAKVHEGDLERALKLFERASRVRPDDFQSVLLQAQLWTTSATSRDIRKSSAASPNSPINLNVIKS